MVLNEKTIKQLISAPSFLSNCNKLAYQLHISRQDASQELLLELLDHRLRKWSNKDVTLAITKDLPRLKWCVKYTRKDLVRKQAKDATRELTKAQMLAGMEPQASNEAETLEALYMLPDMLKNANTRTWAESVLRVGQRETMVRFHQTPRQFNNKLTKVCKYARQHRQPKQSNRHNTKELELLEAWDSLLANESTTDDGVQAFINSHQDYINEIINSPLIKFQGRLIKNFAQASNKDKYVFINLMAKREHELKEKDTDE